MTHKNMNVLVGCRNPEVPTLRPGNWAVCVQYSLPPQGVVTDSRHRWSCAKK